MFSNRFLGRGWSRTGFTLIELLIVIAIILILIAIALPNFLEAQLRAKVTRVKAELKTLEIVHATYYQDFNSYPFNHRASEGAAGSDGDTGMPTTDCNKRTGVFNQAPYWSYEAVGYVLTTPIKYISNAEIKDQFQLNGNPSAGGAPFLYHYTSSKIAHCRGWGHGLAYKYTMAYRLPDPWARPTRLKYPNAAYILWSIGPDTEDHWGGQKDSVGPYSPTNGTSSKGDIFVFVP